MGNKNSFLVAGFVVVAFLLMIPGVRMEISQIFFPKVLALQAVQKSSVEAFNNLYDVSCKLYDELVEDKNNELCNEVGACLRSPEKLRKMCVYRVPNMIKYCNAGKERQARVEISNALNAMDDHIGLRAYYCLTNQIDCSIVANRLGGPWLNKEDVGYGQNRTKHSEIRRHVLEVGQSMSSQNLTIDVYPLSIYAELYHRLQQNNVCE